MTEIALTARVPFCSADDIFAAIQQATSDRAIYTVAGWCPTCRANANHARAVDPVTSAISAGHSDRHLTEIAR